MDNIYVARQPIFDRKMDLLGYELLYRDADVDFANVEDPDLASSQLIINTFINIGMENLVGSGKAFINLPRTFIVENQLLPMTSEQVALEVLETVKPDKAVLEGLKDLVQRGYLIALDDFVYDASLEPMLELANIVKIDIKSMSETDLKQQLDIIRKFNVKFIAEKVETQAQYELSRELGFDYFQGFYFCRPNVVSGKRIPVNKAVVFQLIEKLQDPEISMGDLEKILVQDVTLSYKLLRYINSASFALRQEIDSVKQALIIIGTQTMKHWATLIILSNLNIDKPYELIRTALVRAKMAELLAENTGRADKHQMFTVGLFSLLDALMDIPMIELLDTISFSSPIKMALLDKEGELGDLLNLVIAYERGDWPALKQGAIDSKIYKESYLGALRWADEASRSLIS